MVKCRVFECFSTFYENSYYFSTSEKYLFYLRNPFVHDFAQQKESSQKNYNSNNFGVF